MRRTIVKEGPLVFIRNVLIMEFLAAVFLYFVSSLKNYAAIFHNFGFDRFVGYDTFLELAFSAFQLVYILLLFLDWYFSYYEIRDKEIIRKSGLLFRRRKQVNLSNVATVEIYQSPISRMMSHATIILEHSDDRVTKIKNVGNYDEYIHLIKQSIHEASGKAPAYDIGSLISRGENAFVEFKETLRYDVRKGEASKEIERMVLKTIVGFLNADGGNLLIGVNDDCKVTGVEVDYKALPKKNRDGFENHLNMLVKTWIGLTFAKYVSVRFETIEGKDICVISVHESHKPAYLRNGDKNEEFFVRVGNTTQPFSMSETEEYIRTHWR